jgi:hypothetical protein
MENPNTLTTTLIKTEKPNSYEFGKAGNRFKLYFDSVADLQKQIKELKESGLYTDEII